MNIKTLKQSRKLLLLTCALTPMAVLLLGCISNNVFPFGTRSFHVVDGIHQYQPFFAELIRKVQSGEGLLYSWNGALGFNFWALFSCYLSSPLNLIAFLFPSGMLNEAITLIIFIKASLCGFSCGFYLLRRGVNGSIWRIYPFAVAYSLSAYVIGYSSNLMWLDCVYLLPFVALGIERFVLGGKWKAYLFALFLSIESNFYIGFMVCIFAVLYFIAQLIINRETLKARLFGNLLNVFSRLLTFAEPVKTSSQKWEANLFCGAALRQLSR